MSQCVKMRRKRKGIRILVVIKKDCYDFFIDITAEADLSKKVVGEDYTLKLRFLDGTKVLEEPFHLEILNKKYKDTTITNNSRIVIKNEKYRFEISLSPNLYVLPSKLIQAQQKQKSKKTAKKKKGISVNGIKTPGLAASKITKYTQSNISRPYTGGRCTPK